MLALSATVLISIAPTTPAKAKRLDPDALRMAANYSGTTGEVALIIWQRGSVRLRRESAWLQQRQGVHDVRSVTKSMWALALLSAVEHGHLQLDAPIGPWFPEWQNDNRSALTLRQLMRMTSGLQPHAAAIYRDGRRDLNRASMSAPLTLRPDSSFRYGPAGPELAWEVLRRALARAGESPENWYATRIATPAGAGQVGWMRDQARRPFASAGARTGVDHLLQLGLMLENRGRAPRRRQVLSPASLQTLLQPSPLNPAFGFGAWLNRQAARPDSIEAFIEDLLSLEPGGVDWSRICLSRHAPTDLVTMLGSSGQRVYVSASHRLVVVRLGEGPNFRDSEFLRLLFQR
jgi:CubicO group peptidase (beta-lactamase class C family)